MQCGLRPALAAVCTRNHDFGDSALARKGEPGNFVESLLVQIAPKRNAFGRVNNNRLTRGLCERPGVSILFRERGQIVHYAADRHIMGSVEIARARSASQTARRSKWRARKIARETMDAVKDVVGFVRS